MSSLLYLVFVMLVIPAATSWVARRFIRSRRAVVSSVIVVFGAALPAAWILFATQRADGITQAAGSVVVPFLFIMMLLPAGFGCSIALSQLERRQERE